MKASLLVAVVASVVLPLANAQESEVEDILLPEASWALCSDAAVNVEPDRCNATCVADLVATEGAIEFSPATGAPPEVGLVYVPGGLVDPRAYSVFARYIASHGYFAAIVPFPDNISFFEPLRPSSVISAHPEIRAWAVVGHSLGALTAATYATADPLGKVGALAMYAGYPDASGDLSDSSLPVLSVVASEDGVLNFTAYESAQSRLPPSSTHTVMIEGGNHEGFGYYVRPDGFDGLATISRWQQHRCVLRPTLDLLASL